MEELNNGSISHTPWLSSSSDENVVIIKKHDKMAQESSLSLKLRRKTMNDDIEIDEKDLVMTEVETTTQSVSTTDPLAVRQPKDQGRHTVPSTSSFSLHRIMLTNLSLSQQPLHLLTRLSIHQAT